MKINSVPLTDSIVIAISKLVDDAREQLKREPSHSDLTYLFKRSGLIHLDPKEQGQSVGKAKRVRTVLSSSLEDEYHKGEKLVKILINNIKGLGGFRKESSNFVGQESIDNESQHLSLKVIVYQKKEICYLLYSIIFLIGNVQRY